MAGGYGGELLSKIRKMKGTESEFPWTTGRDFSGVIVDTGKGINPAKLKVGDEVSIAVILI